MKQLTKVSALVLLYLHVTVCNYLFMSLSSQLFIPGQHYSVLNINYNIDPIQNKRFNINISLSLNQVTQKQQTNSIFDIFTCSTYNTDKCLQCYTQNYNNLNARYAKNEPCIESCTDPELNNLKNETLLTQYYRVLTANPKSNNQTFVIDNTFFPCQRGAYQPQLYLEQQISLSIQQNNIYSAVIKITFVLLLQFMMMIIAYLLIMLRKYRKLNKKLQYMKGQEEAQDLLNSFLANSVR